MHEIVFSFMKNILFFFISIVLAVSSISIAHADIFELHFSYDAQKNHIDFADAQNAVSVNKEKNMSIVEFSDSVTSGPFEFAFLDSLGDELEMKQFTPQQGVFVIETPYYSTATKLIIRKTGTTNIILTQDVTLLSTCNNNKICEFEKGENAQSCLPDCASGDVVYSVETQAKLDANQGVLKDPRTGDTLLDVVKVVAPEIPTTTPVVKSQTSVNNAPSTMMSLIYTAIALIVLGYGTYFIYRKW
jgi:hypothetical protein